MWTTLSNSLMAQVGFVVYLVATWWLYSLSPCSLNSRARPKSAIFRCPEALMRRFAGLRSYTKTHNDTHRHTSISIRAFNLKAQTFSRKACSSHPVYDVVLVQECHTLQKHHHVAFDLSGRQKSFGIPDDFGEVREHEVKDQEEARTMREDVLQFYYLKGQEKWMWCWPLTPTWQLLILTCGLSSISCRAFISLSAWLGMPSSSLLRATFFRATVSPVYRRAHTLALQTRCSPQISRERLTFDLLAQLHH